MSSGLTRALVAPWLLAALCSCNTSRPVQEWPGDDGGGGGGTDAAPPAACSALFSYNAGKQVASFQTRRALITPDLRRAWLISHRDNADGDLYELRLPGGKPVLREKGITEVTWLSATSELLARRITDKKLRAGDLLALKPGAGKARLLAKDVCSYRALPSGDAVFVARDCDTHHGRLERVDMASAKATTLAGKVRHHGVILDRPGARLAYMVPTNTGSDCFGQTGHVMVYDMATGKQTRLGQDVSPGSLHFSPRGDLLLYRRIIACKGNTQALMAARLPGGTPVKAVQMPGYGLFGHFDLSTGRWTYAVSPDGKQVLAAELPASGMSASLISVNTDGTGSTVLADDLFPYQAVSLAFRVWTFTADGSHALYAANGGYPAMALGAAPVGVGKPRRLSPSLYGAWFQPSGAGAMVVHVRGGGAGANELWVDDLKQKGAGTKITSSAYALGHVRWVPGDRGLLWTERPKGGVETLNYAGRAGGKVTRLR